MAVPDGLCARRHLVSAQLIRLPPSNALNGQSSRFESTVETTGTVLVSAHYDSRGSFGSLRAPGADDDGSGTTAVLNIARTIGRLGITFKQNVEIVFFAGEEQGLWGSKGYSSSSSSLYPFLPIVCAKLECRAPAGRRCKRDGRYSWRHACLPQAWGTVAAGHS